MEGDHGPVSILSSSHSPFRETSNIEDGSKFCAGTTTCCLFIVYNLFVCCCCCWAFFEDMAIQNVIGDSFRGATWVAIHNGGGVGWGEVINGGFGLVLDGSEVRLKYRTRC